MSVSCLFSIGRRSRSEGEWKPRWATTLVGQDKERSHATSSARLPTMASSTRCFIEARVLASALQSRTFRGKGRVRVRVEFGLGLRLGFGLGLRIEIGIELGRARSSPAP